jgi:hypothetical protein
MTAVVEKSPERELVEAVIVPIVVVLLCHFVIVISQLVRVDGVKVGGVCVVEDAGLVGRFATSQGAAEVNVLEEGLQQKINNVIQA